MDLALYCPVYGYYEKERDNIGRRGDYYTSVSTGKLFGQLLAAQFSDWLTALDGAPGCQGSGRVCSTAGQGQEPPGQEFPGRLQLVEAGAHRGDLAGDILDWMSERRPEVLEKIEYWILEPSERRRALQRRTLERYAGRILWARDFSELAARGGAACASRAAGKVRGIIFSNELLDAMPVHRFGWDADRKKWFEWGVGFEEGSFVRTRLATSEKEATPATAAWDGLAAHLRSLAPEIVKGPEVTERGCTGFGVGLGSLEEVLPEGFTVEVCPGASDWWCQAAQAIEAGRLMTIDYGLMAEEFFLPQRAQGTLRAYSGHAVRSEVLGRPGEQDLTASVNFTALQNLGEEMGLRTETFASQTQFLTGIASRIWNLELTFGPWTTELSRQFQTLTHPDQLGRAFRVLVQSKLPV